MFCSFQIETTEIIALFESLDPVLQLQYLKDYKGFIDNVNAVYTIKKNASVIAEKLSNGSRLQELSFPSEIISNNFDVFISHAHLDEEKKGLITKLAAYLFGMYGIRCFIDSEYWDYCDEIIKKINKSVGDQYVYRLESGQTLKTYDTNKLLYVSSNVHAMLSMALMRMIDYTPCVIFVDSEESITYKSDNRGKIHEITMSPWIYEEICYVNSLTRKKPDYYKERLQEGHECFSATFGFDVDKGNFKKLNAAILKKLVYKKRKESMCKLFDKYLDLRFPGKANHLFL